MLMICADSTTKPSLEHRSRPRSTSPSYSYSVTYRGVRLLPVGVCHWTLLGTCVPKPLTWYTPHWFVSEIPPCVCLYAIPAAIWPLMHWPWHFVWSSERLSPLSLLTFDTSFPTTAQSFEFRSSSSSSRTKRKEPEKDFAQSKVQLSHRSSFFFGASTIMTTVCQHSLQGNKALEYT